MAQMDKDREYFKYNIPPSWEELKEKQDNSKSWDMSDMSNAIKEMNSKTLPSLDKLKKRHEMLQAKLLEREEKQEKGNVYRKGSTSNNAQTFNGHISWKY